MSQLHMNSNNSGGGGSFSLEGPQGKIALAMVVSFAAVAAAVYLRAMLPDWAWLVGGAVVFGGLMLFLMKEVSAAPASGGDSLMQKCQLSALESAKANVMIADADMNIIYMNTTMREMFRIAESDIRQALPNFNAATLIGANADIFHKNPAHQRGMIQNLDRRYDTTIKVGRRTFSLIANPIRDDNGARLGTIIEWADITDKLEAEEKLNLVARNNLRIKVALDGATTNVMVADNDMTIIYMNETMKAMMKNAESDIRKDLPNFDASNLMGAKADIFHKDPSHQRKMIERLQSSFETQIVVGGRTFNLIASPVVNEGERLGTVVEWEDVTEQLAEERKAAKIAEENMRVRVALDGVTTNVMMADNDYRISYMNRTMVQMLQNAEADIRKVLPNFNSSRLMGENIDVFHKDPSHQRSMLERLSGTYQTEITVGVRKFSLVANPIIDADGNRLGSVVEWSDVTNERNTEEELRNVVDAAANGDFTQRVPLENKEGFLKAMATGINTISETCAEGLNDIADMMQALSRGDLTQRINNDFGGTFARLREDCNETADRLADIVSQIYNSASEVSNAAGEITSGSADLSHRTETQASALEETAASMEEMAATVKNNADNAINANDLGNQASNVAEKGGKVVANAVDAMARIEESSQKISDIIGVIDEIAFQTNLLALNAAVEAARAGEAGKGFAVVASEVRNLAQRSSEAAKDIKGLIVDSSVQVKDGVELVNEAGKSLDEIVTSIKQVTELISDIASASKEQASGVEEINSAVTDMDEMTQQNSALVEENAAAARALEEQSVNMHTQVSFFKIDGVQNSPAGGRQGGGRGGSSGGGQKAIQQRKAAPAKNAPAVSGDDDDWSEF